MERLNRAKQKRSMNGSWPLTTCEQILLFYSCFVFDGMPKYTSHLLPEGPLSAATADAFLQLGEAVFPVHREFLEAQSWLMQGIFETHAQSEDRPIVQLRSQELSGGPSGGTQVAFEAKEALNPVHLEEFLFQAYRPETPVSCESGEERAIDILSAADFFSDEYLKNKCSLALAASASKRLKGLHDPLPLSVNHEAHKYLKGLQLEDSATTVLKEHGSPVRHAEDEWDTEVHVLQANNLKAQDRQLLVRYLRLAAKYDLPHLLAECLPHLCKLVVAASSHLNLRHTVHECLPLLNESTKMVMMTEIAQLASTAAGDAGLLRWQIDSQMVLIKLQEYQQAEGTQSGSPRSSR